MAKRNTRGQVPQMKIETPLPVETVVAPTTTVTEEETNQSTETMEISETTPDIVPTIIEEEPMEEVSSAPAYLFFPNNLLNNSRLLNALTELKNFSLNSIQANLGSAQRTIYQNMQRVLAIGTDEEVFAFLSEYCRYIRDNQVQFNADNLLVGFDKINLSAKQSLEAQRLFTIVVDIANSTDPRGLSRTLPWDNILNSLHCPEKETIVGNLQQFLVSKV